MDFKRITFEESVAMITTVADSVFTIDEKTGKMLYLPENYDYSFRLCIAHYYNEYEITGDIDKDYKTAMNIHISDEAIDQSQLLGIQNAIKEKIDMRKAEINKSNITVTSQLDELMEALMPVLETLGHTINDRIAELDADKLNERIENMNIENPMS